MSSQGSLLSRISVGAVALVIGAGLMPLAAGAASPMTALPTAPLVPFSAHGSTDEAYVVGARPGDSIQLLLNGNDDGAPAVADSLGSLTIRNLTPGSGYAFRDVTRSETSPSFAVFSPSYVPPASLYNQPLHVGLNYVTMRDGVKIAMTVRLPLGATSLSQGPFPTVMEYSGYGTAGPADPIKVILDHANPNNPLLPDSATDVGAVVARLEGFATVSVQMRGTGCSGGAFDLFGYPSDFDGYDAIQTIGGQSWVLHHKIGLVGISYSGISQLEVAGTEPPDLAAIAPLSPTDDLFSTGYPGGIYNDGFAAGWISQRIDDAKSAATLSGTTLSELPAAARGGTAQPWTYAEIQAEAAQNVTTCLTNQVLHGQSESLSTLVGPGLVRTPSLFNRRAPVDWAPDIKVPVFISGALEDEQTGPQWPALITALSHDKDPSEVFANMVNGNHIDSLDSVTASRWLEFLDIFVADKVPTQPNFVGQAGLNFASTAAGAPAVAPPPLRFTTAANAAVARHDFDVNTPRVRVLFDSGGGSLGSGAIQPTYQAGYSSWPPAGTLVTWHFGARGSLDTTTGPPGSDTFTPDLTAGQNVNVNPPGSSPWPAKPLWDWQEIPAADGVAYQTPPFTKNTTIVGPATANLYINPGSGTTTNVQVTVTEVRPGNPGMEEYVTSGFLSSNFRTLMAASTALWTQPNYAASTGPLTPDTFTMIHVPIDPIGHTFRAGTELRIVISSPGGDRPSWQFAAPGVGAATTLKISLAQSSLVVNEVPLTVPPTATLPACGSLRGEPCRAYQNMSNQTSI